MNVSIRSAAREDILRQYSYYLIEKEAVRVAQRFLDAVQATIEMLCGMPSMGTPKIFENARLVGLRSWPVDGFSAIRIYYYHDDETLRVLRVLHGKRDLDPLLEEETLEDD